MIPAAPRAKDTREVRRLPRVPQLVPGETRTPQVRCRLGAPSPGASHLLPCPLATAPLHLLETLQGTS